MARTIISEKMGQIDASRKKIRGKDVKPFMGLLPNGVRRRLNSQVVSANPFASLVTVGGTVGTGAYTIPIDVAGGTSYANFSYTAGASDTNRSVRDGLMKVINAAGLNIQAVNPVDAATAAGDYKFHIIADSAFTHSTIVKPTNATLTAGTVSTGAATAKGATTITLGWATTEEMQANQTLGFLDENDTMYLATLSAKAVIGATTLSVRALDEAIPAGATGDFPVYIWDRTDASVDRSYNLASTTDFNTGNDRDGVVTGGEKNVSIPGNFAYKNPGGITLLYAAEAGLEFDLQRRFDAPSDLYRTGKIQGGAALVTSAPEGASGDSFVTQDFECAYVGKTYEIDPVII